MVVWKSDHVVRGRLSNYLWHEESNIYGFYTEEQFSPFSPSDMCERLVSCSTALLRWDPSHLVPTFPPPASHSTTGTVCVYKHKRWWERKFKSHYCTMYHKGTLQTGTPNKTWDCFRFTWHWTPFVFLVTSFIVSRFMMVTSLSLPTPALVWFNVNPSVTTIRAVFNPVMRRGVTMVTLALPVSSVPLVWKGGVVMMLVGVSQRWCLMPIPTVMVVPIFRIRIQRRPGTGMGPTSVMVGVSTLLMLVSPMFQWVSIPLSVIQHCSVSLSVPIFPVLSALVVMW